jgi:fibro-slime domain-containing protein
MSHDLKCLTGSTLALVVALALANGCGDKVAGDDDEVAVDSDESGTKSGHFGSDDESEGESIDASDVGASDGDGSEEASTATDGWTGAGSDDDVDSSAQSDDSSESGESSGTDSTATSGDSSGDSGESESESSTDSDSGESTSSDSTTEEGDNDPCDNILYATVRDMSLSHPDFEVFSGSVPTTGLVEDMLDSDLKPVHAAAGATSQTTGPTNFYQWYHDVDGINYSFAREIVLSEVEPGVFRYENTAFFPLGTSEGWGSESKDKNYGFTTEVHMIFQYAPGQVFDFDGDDDLWLFVEGKLVLDLGGLHPPAQGSVNLDDFADELNLEAGGLYHMDIFHAERHSTGSRFVIETSIGCILPQ